MRSTAEHVAFGTVNAAMNAWPESWSGIGSLSSWYSVGTAVDHDHVCLDERADLRRLERETVAQER